MSLVLMVNTANNERKRDGEYNGIMERVLPEYEQRIRNGTFADAIRYAMIDSDNQDVTQPLTRWMMYPERYMRTELYAYGSDDEIMRDDEYDRVFNLSDSVEPAIVRRKIEGKEHDILDIIAYGQTCGSAPRKI